MVTETPRNTSDFPAPENADASCVTESIQIELRTDVAAYLRKVHKEQCALLNRTPTFEDWLSLNLNVLAIEMREREERLAEVSGVIRKTSQTFRSMRQPVDPSAKITTVIVNGVRYTEANGSLTYADLLDLAGMRGADCMVTYGRDRGPIHTLPPGLALKLTDGMDICVRERKHEFRA